MATYTCTKTITPNWTHTASPTISQTPTITLTPLSFGVGEPDTYEPDNDFANASFVNENEQQAHNIFPMGDIDYVKFTITEYTSLKFYITEGDLVSYFKMDVMVYNETFTPLAGYTMPADTFINFTLNPGDYYLRIKQQYNAAVSEPLYYYYDLIPTTPTFTKTITLTNTATVTETITSTSTITLTSTFTPTITLSHTITPTITNTITNTVTPTITNTHEIGADWIRADTDTGISSRRDHAMASHGGYMFIAGGNYILSYPEREILRSADGALWEITSADSAASSKSKHGMVVHNGNMWILGGYGPATFTTYYSSSGYGWGTGTSDGGLYKRFDFASTVHNGYIFVMGGQGNAAPNYYNDVWKSADGAIWTEVNSSAPFGQRYFGTAVSFVGKLWILGGLNYGVGANREIWTSSDDGVTWIREKETAEFLGEMTYKAVVYDGKIWMLSPDGVWWSANGLDWYESAGSPPFSGCSYIAATVHNDGIWVSGSPGTNHMRIWHTP